MESHKVFFCGSNGSLQPFQVAKIYGTMDDLRLENERVQDGQMGGCGTWNDLGVVYGEYREDWGCFPFCCWNRGLRVRLKWKCWNWNTNHSCVILLIVSWLLSVRWVVLSGKELRSMKKYRFTTFRDSTQKPIVFDKSDMWVLQMRPGFSKYVKILPFDTYFPWISAQKLSRKKQ